MRITLLALPLLAACAGTAPTAGVRSWGSMREALRDGQTQARVDAAAIASEVTMGVGAAADLDGEITILDGEVLRTRVVDGRPTTTPTDTAPATLLAVADVPLWTEVTIDRDLDAAALEAFVEERAAAAGIDTSAPFGFQVRGALKDLRLHVINGQCPVRARMMGDELTKPPFEREHASIDGALVGIYARDAAGQLTHHDSSMHVHAVLGGDGGRWTGHVESTGVSAGSVLRLPYAARR